jgi:ribosomal protein S18 acetylase RimI-like enzyme
MEDIVHTLIGEDDPQKAREFLLHFVEMANNQYSYQNCWVAEDDKKVVGAINLYDGVRLKELRQPIVDYLKHKFDRDFVFGDETQAGEYYIDSLGVNSNQQGKGIGTKLLQFLINEYVAGRGQTLGLLVDDINPNAKRLYLKLGFKPVRKRVLFGKSMEHLQINADQVSQAKDSSTN